MEGSLRHFIVTQRFLGFLRCENLAGFTLSARECLWIASLTIDHLLEADGPSTGRVEIQLPPYPRNRTQLGNRGMSEMCRYCCKSLFGVANENS